MLKSLVINRIDSCESTLDLSIHCSAVSTDIQVLSNTSAHNEFYSIKKSERWDLKAKTIFFSYQCYMQEQLKRALFCRDSSAN